MELTKSAEEFFKLYLQYKSNEALADGADAEEVCEDMTCHLEGKVEEKALGIIDLKLLKSLLSEMGEAEVLAKIAVQQNSNNIWNENFLLRHQKIILSVILFMLSFFILKFLTVDGIKAKSGKTEKEVGPYTSTIIYNEPKLNIKDNPELEKLLNNSQSLKLVMVAGIAIAFSFWFWMLVECLVGERYPKKGIFFKSPEKDRFIWAIFFVGLNILGAILYKVVVSKKLKMEATDV